MLDCISKVYIYIRFDFSIKNRSKSVLFGVIQRHAKMSNLELKTKSIDHFD